jgi:hypothetical protein
MDHRINPFRALIIAGLALTILTPSQSIAQTKSTNNWQHLSLVSSKHLANKNENETSFDLQFETDNLLLSGQAETFGEGYDSLHLISYEVMENEENLMKIKAYLINKETQDKLWWLSAVNFTTTSKDVALVSGSYIQFAAYNKLENAEKGLAFFNAFNLDIVYVGGMYKLVAPYEKKELSRAVEQYKNYDIWRVEYEGIKVIHAAQSDVIASSTSKNKKEDLSARL